MSCGGKDDTASTCGMWEEWCPHCKVKGHVGERCWLKNCVDAIYMSKGMGKYNPDEQEHSLQVQGEEEDEEEKKGGEVVGEPPMLEGGDQRVHDADKRWRRRRASSSTSPRHG